MSTNGHLSTASNAQACHLSPSLGHTRLGPAYEIKFLLNHDQAAEAEQRLLDALLPDPHSDPALGGMYEIQSLACDDPRFGVFFREERTRNRKYRVRRYGLSDTVYLERKRTLKSKVRKHRVQAALLNLSSLAEADAGDAEHAWFARAVQANDLAPVCRVRYLRRALFGATADGPMRVTFDRQIQGSLAPEWSLDLDVEERHLLPDFVVCEFKFRTTMPAPLKAVIAAMHLQPTGVSKYRTCIRAFAPELGITLPAPVLPVAHTNGTAHH